MNTIFRRSLASIFLLLALPLAIQAQTPATDPSKESNPATTSAASTAAATSTTASAPADATSTASVSASGPATTASSTASPATSAAAPAPAAVAPASTAAGTTASTTHGAVSTESATTSTTLRTLATAGDSSTEAAPAAPSAPDEPVASKPKKSHRIHSDGNDRVTVGGNSNLSKGESADSVVAIGGNAESEGEVRDSVVAVAGNARATGPVENAVVAVVGNAYVDSRVRTVVAVFGNVELGPNAEVMTDVVCVLGEVKRDPGAIVHGNVPHIGGGHINLHLEGLQAYLMNCVLKLRPLAIAPHLGWAWAFAGSFFVLYLLLALLFGRGVETNCRTLEQNPGASLLTALLTLLLTPVALIILSFTIVGAPALLIALLCASLFGRAVMLAWLGRRIASLVPNAGLHPVVHVLIGGILVLALYLVPIVGLIVHKLLGFVGLGVVVYTIILSSKREKAARAAAAAASAAAAPAAAVIAPETVGATETVPPVAGVPIAATVPPPVIVTALPRAGFWVRIGAMAIDLILVAVVLGIVQSALPHFMRVQGPGSIMIVAAIYASILWKQKGTTIGGIVCGLRVVRTDGRPIDWATAFVRGASCFLSLIVVFLGFIWVAFDDEKQSWHDKIAGTTVVHHRGNISLV